MGKSVVTAAKISSEVAVAGSNAVFLKKPAAAVLPRSELVGAAVVAAFKYAAKRILVFSCSNAEIRMSCSICLDFPRINSAAVSTPQGATRVPSVSKLLEDKLVLGEVFKGECSEAIQVEPFDCCVGAEQVWTKFEEARTIISSWAAAHSTKEKTLVEEVFYLNKPDTGGPNIPSRAGDTERGTQTGGLLVVAKTRRHALRLDITFRYNMLLFY